MRTLVKALCLLALLLPTGCSDAPVPTELGVRIRLVTLDADGPVPLPVFLTKVGEPDDGREYPLEATPEKGVYWARGAAAGAYHVRCPAQWGMLWTQPLPPQLDGDLRRPPRAVPMGRPESLYLTTEDARRWALGGEWGMDVVRPDSRALREQVPITVGEQDGWVSLRVPTEFWQPGGEYRVVGRMSDGAPSQLISFFLPQEGHRRPRLALAHPAPSASLVVRVVPPPLRDPEPVPDGTIVHLAQFGLPLALRSERPTYRGTVAFDQIAALDDTLHLAAGAPPTAPSSLKLSFSDWQRLGEAWIMGPVPEAESRRVVLRREGLQVPDSELLVRAEGADVYALTPVQPHEAGLVFQTGEGAQHIWLRTGTRWISATIPAGRGSDATAVDLGEPEAGVRVLGGARGAMPGQRVRFFRREAQRLVIGHGFDVVVTQSGSYEAHLPPGEYEAGIVRADGQLALRVAMRLQPGTEVRRDLSLP